MNLNDVYPVKRGHFSPNPDKPGYAKLDRLSTFSEICDGLDHVLTLHQSTECPGVTLKGVAESYGMDFVAEKELGKDFEVPLDVRLKVVCGRGHCEGFRVSVVMFHYDFNKTHRDTVATDLWSMKCFNEEDAWLAARRIDQSLEAGLY